MKSLLSVLIVTFFYFSVSGSTHSNISGGLSVRFGKHYSIWQPGFNVGFAVIGKPVEYVGLGGEVSYTRWGQKKIPGTSYDRRSFHYTRGMFLFQGCYPLKSNFILQFEIGEGVAVEMDITYTDKDANGDVKPRNGMLFGGGVILKYFSMAIRSNLVFDKPNIKKWVSFNVGFYY